MQANILVTDDELNIREGLKIAILCYGHRAFRETAKSTKILHQDDLL